MKYKHDDIYYFFLILTIKMTLMKISQSKQTKSLGKQAMWVNKKTFAALPQKVSKVNALIYG